MLMYFQYLQMFIYEFRIKDIDMHTDITEENCNTKEMLKCKY